jgi:hypothetical protein
VKLGAPAKRYVVWCLDDEETENDARTIEAYDAETAAETWAERDDYQSAEYRIVGGTDVTVCVKDEEGTVLRFRLSGESVPSYTAREVEPDPHAPKCSVCDDQGRALECSEPCALECTCSRCSREPFDERFFACKAHQQAVYRGHLRVRGYPPIWARRQ